MAVERKIDFLSLLKRRRDNLKAWMQRNNVKNYIEMCKLLDGMNAEHLDKTLVESLLVQEKQMAEENVEVILELPEIMAEEPIQKKKAIIKKLKKEEPSSS